VLISVRDTSHHVSNFLVKYVYFSIYYIHRKSVNAFHCLYGYFRNIALLHNFLTWLLGEEVYEECGKDSVKL
jgi:hypothetical protein